MKETPKIVIYNVLKWKKDISEYTVVDEVEEIPIDLEWTAQEFKTLLKDKKILYHTSCGYIYDEIDIPLYPIGYTQGIKPTRIIVYFNHNQPKSKIRGITGNKKIINKGTFWCGESYYIKHNQILYKRKWFDLL